MNYIQLYTNYTKKTWKEDTSNITSTYLCPWSAVPREHGSIYGIFPCVWDNHVKA